MFAEASARRSAPVASLLSPDSTVGQLSEADHGSPSQSSCCSADSDAAQVDGLDSPYHDSRRLNRQEYSLDEATPSAAHKVGCEPTLSHRQAERSWFGSSSASSVQQTPINGSIGTSKDHRRSSLTAVDVNRAAQSSGSALDTMAGLLVSPLALSECTDPQMPQTGILTTTAVSGSSHRQEPMPAPTQHGDMQQQRESGESAASLADSSHCADLQQEAQDWQHRHLDDMLTSGSLDILAENLPALGSLAESDRCSLEESSRAPEDTSKGESRLRPDNGLLDLLGNISSGPIELDTSLLYSPASTSLAAAQMSASPSNDDASPGKKTSEDAEHEVRFYCKQ